jgi:hypothetical protein
MRFSRHLKLLFVVTVAWLLFWVAGLPDYYKQYSTTFMIVFDVVVLPPLWFVLYSSIRKSRRGRGFANSLWLAFYVTIPLFIYDLIYCGYYLGYGISFIWEYWYLTVYYVLPWLILPPTGWWIEQQHQQETI